jgi:hypothetical protein
LNAVFRYVFLSLMVLKVTAVWPSTPEGDTYVIWRAQAAHVLAARHDSESLVTAAALTFVGVPWRTKAEVAKAASGAVAYAVKASELAPDNPAITWLRLHLCANATACDTRDAATIMRWVDADNAAAWLPTLAAAQRERDIPQVDRILDAMAQGKRFDIYPNRTTVMVFDALNRARAALPTHYAASDLLRLTEAMGLAGAAIMPSFSPLINACRDTALAERREACIRLSMTMQKGDAVMTQLVGFAIERRLTAADSKERQGLDERRRLLEWRVSSAHLSDAPLLPWLRNARARDRLATMRTLPREEDVCIALAREQGLPLVPPEEHR